MAAGLATHKDLVSGTLEKMFDLYNEKVLSYLHFLSFHNNIIFHKQNMLPMPEFDDYGMIIPASLNKRDEWEARSGIADTLKSCSDILDEIADVIKIFAFFIDREVRISFPGAWRIYPFLNASLGPR